MSTSDFTCRNCYVGLMSWNANVEFRNMVFKSVDPSATLGIATSYEKVKGEEFTINANQNVTYTSSHPDIVSIESGNGSSSTTFKVNELGKANISAVSVDNPSLEETIRVTGLETDPTAVSGLVDGLDGFNTIGGRWYVKDCAYVSEVSGDKFAISDTIVNVTTGAACTFSTNATIKSDSAAALILSNDKENPVTGGSIIANVNKNGEWRIFRFPECDNLTDIDGNECKGNLETVAEDGVYELKLEVNGTEIKYYINNELLATIDLRNWDFVNVLDISENKLGSIWECPDFFNLDGHDIMIISPQ